MLNEQTLKAIYDGEIRSRRQLYERVGGRSRKLRQWLDSEELLVPKQWDKQSVIAKMRDMKEELGRLPRASDNSQITKLAQSKFGSWNEAMADAFGRWNQRRYDSYSDQDLLKIIQEFVRTKQRLPLREEFDGHSYPYFEAYTSRFGGTWHEVLGAVNLDGIKYYAHSYGWGKVILQDGRTYLSRQEALIGGWLTKNGIEFQQEVPYGTTSKFRFDFMLTDYEIYIEYYGISTDEYSERIEAKRKAYDGRRVIEIFKHDNTVGKLATEVQRLEPSLAH